MKMKKMKEVKTRNGEDKGEGKIIKRKNNNEEEESEEIKDEEKGKR